MTPSTKILILTLVSGILTAGLFAALFYLFIAQAVGFTFGSGLFENPILGGIAYLGTFAFLFLCPFICPILAFYFRNAVFEVTPSSLGRALIFILISVFPAIVLAVGYGGIAIYASSKEKRAREAHEDRRAFLDEIKSSGIEVVAGEAIVIRESENFAVARVTFSLRNLPTTVPEYNLGLFRGANEKGLRYKFDHPRNTENYEYITSITAKNENGAWVFYKHASGEEISRDAERVTFDIQISGWRSSYMQLSTTVMPIVSIWRDLEGSPYKNHPVWQEAIPITIRRSVEPL